MQVGEDGGVEVPPAPAHPVVRVRVDLKVARRVDFEMIQLNYVCGIYKKGPREKWDVKNSCDNERRTDQGIAVLYQIILQYFKKKNHLESNNLYLF